MPIDLKDLDRMQAYCDAATKPPWKVCEHSWAETSIFSETGWTICSMSIREEATEDTQSELEAGQQANARLFVSSRTDLPALIAAHRKLLEMLRTNVVEFSPHDEATGTLGQIGLRVSEKGELVKI